MNALCVMPKIAGIESSAKSRSVVPIAMKHDEDRREHARAVDGGAQLDAVVVVGDAHALAQHPHEAAVVLLRALLAVQERLLDRRPHEPGAEDVEDPAEVLDELRAEQDEDAAEDQREDDAHHEHLLLHLLRHGEPRHDDDEDEQVVDREAVLGEPADDELPGVLGIAERAA